MFIFNELVVQVRRVTLFRTNRFFASIAVFTLISAWGEFLANRSYFHPFAFRTFYQFLPWAVLAGFIVGVACGVGITLYNPFPRTLQGRIFLDKIDDAMLWYHQENGKQHYLPLRKLVVNVHSETRIDFGLPPKTLVVETTSPDDMTRLCAALRPEVRILRSYDGS